MVYNLLI